ncbi:MAG: primosomal protein N' [Bacilli bacterium]|nr:primosomal protein N' [Bacilli bacterium]
MFAEILVELKTKKIDQTFTYKIPDHLINEVQIGKRVLIPFGNQTLEGFVINILNCFDCDYKVKSIIEVIDEYPVLNEEMLKLGIYMSKKTICNLINCYQTMLPTALKAKNGTLINKKYETYISLNDKNYIPKNELQRQILDKFKTNDLIIKSELNNISLSSVNTMLKNNILSKEVKEKYRLDNQNIKEKCRIELNELQKQAVNKISNTKKFKPYLLHGVTGSGKTEVYMHIIEEVIKNKKEAIVLVPEISLTPQLVNLFKKRFGSLIAILHSGLSNGEKYDEWRKIEKKEVSIVIGARSAIFAPFTNLGIIIIDEEHSNTYKQENNPKYNAIDIALFRAKKYNIPLVLGSATPSLESYTRAKTNIYELITLNKRINNKMPNTYLIDMKQEIRKGNNIISSLLKEKIEEKLNKNEQIILLLNRRGYTTISTCKNCGYVHKCEACDIPLTYHKTSNTMRCHYCGHGEQLLKICPECHSEDINSFGMGTEKLEQYISDNFKNAKTIRMDNDTTSNKGSHEKIIKDFKDEKYNILVGTQMIAKGLDFPKVTLVGVINGDSSLNIPDFRSAERTFQLINQVAGRAGRASLEGEVIIQGFNIDHYSIIKASKNDYEGFYNEEMNIRKILKYSPYFNLSIIKIKNKDYDLALREANKIANYLRNKNLKDILILGPTSSMIPKINNIYNLQIILKYKRSDELIKELNYINDLYRTNKVIVDIDVNPYIV